MNVTFRPIQTWPRPFTKYRRHSTFTAVYGQTLELLERELDKLNARSIVIQLAMQARDIRNDGLPRANARKPEHPGVILSFESKHGSLSYACDEFFKWEDNLRGIALTLERLRLVDLYGVTKSGEQYRGWEALPPAGGTSSGSDFASAEAAALFILKAAGATVSNLSVEMLLRDPDALKTASQAAKKRLHPDVVGGSHEQFVKLQQALALLQQTR